MIKSSRLLTKSEINKVIGGVVTGSDLQARLRESDIRTLEDLISYAKNTVMADTVTFEEKAPYAVFNLFFQTAIPVLLTNEIRNLDGSSVTKRSNCKIRDRLCNRR